MFLFSKEQSWNTLKMIANGNTTPSIGPKY